MRFRFWVLIAVGLFIIGIGAGAAVYAIMPAGITDLFSQQLSDLGELGASLDPFNVTTAIFIFFKNATALLFSFIFSPFLLVIPVLALLLNSALISYIAMVVIQKESFWLLLAGLLPHGIFEIPAFIIGEAAALSFGIAAITALCSKRSRGDLGDNFKKNARYLLLAFILLIPAAIIETFVTPLFIQ